MSKKRRRRGTAGLRLRRASPPGTAPGSITVDPNAPRPVIRVLAFNAEQYVEKEIRQLDELPPLLDRWPVTWIQVVGLGDAATITALGEMFHLHPLALEDVVHVHQRAKVDDYPDQLLVVARMTCAGQLVGQSDQFSMFLGRNYVLSFDERPGDCLEPIRQRIRSDPGTIRPLSPDYLAYTILDAIIDQYFPVLEEYAERLEALDEQVSVRSGPEIMERIHELRNELLLLRRSVWPLREAINSLARDPRPLVADATRLYLRDCLDHLVVIMDLVEIYRELCSDLRDYALATVSNRLNEVMKVLTVIATLFMPLSFIAGVYGMNFNPELSPWNMPETRWYLGYPFALTIMASVAGGLLYYFYRKGWLGPLTAMPERGTNGDRHRVEER